MVIYYNTEPRRLRPDGAPRLDVPEVPERAATRWTLDAVHRRRASSPAGRAGGTKGVYIEPTLRGLAPFIYSGGGQVFDDDDEPDVAGLLRRRHRSALEQTLAVLRDPQLTLTERAARAGAPRSSGSSAASSAMIAGFRDLVPELRRSRASTST